MLRMQAWLVFASVAVGAALGGHAAEEESATRAESAKLIAEALAKAKDRPAEEQLETFRAIAKVVRDKCPNNVVIAERLRAAASREELEAALRASYDMLTFKMKMEADLPAGFPQPTPVGEIQVKHYPAYRSARTASQQNSGFFKLLAHITLSRIEMTAPVEMTYATDANKEPEQIDMAFLYGDSKLGQPGDKLGGVTVQDIPALTTVSIGLKGDNDRAKLAEVERQLEEWLSQQATDYARAGNLRVLGYNSPQVPADSRYYEVELPSKKK